MNNKLIKNTKRQFRIFTFIIAILIVTMSVGYAFFNESLTINGVASTLEYYEGDKLPVTAVIRNTSSNRYYTQDTTKNGLSFSQE